MAIMQKELAIMTTTYKTFGTQLRSPNLPIYSVEEGTKIQSTVIENLFNEIRVEIFSNPGK
jgi:hypothetical protein